MKVILSLLSAVLILTAPTAVFAGTPSTISIASPDRPRTWLVGGNDKLDQRLRWSDRQNVLLLDVTYSLLFYTDQLHPTQYQTYTVSFPGVHLSPGDRSLYFEDGNGHQVILGYLRTGIFGQQVVLNSNVVLSAKRNAGFLEARLLVSGASF